MTKDEVLAVLDETIRKTQDMMPTPMGAHGEAREHPVHFAGRLHDLRRAFAAVAALYEAQAWRKTEDERPEDGQLIAYYFEPFGSAYAGTYEAASDSVFGRNGFTTMAPEVPYWFALPPIPSEAQPRSEADK